MRLVCYEYPLHNMIKVENSGDYTHTRRVVFADACHNTRYILYHNSRSTYNRNYKYCHIRRDDTFLVSAGIG
jgi:hypothetical protein